MFQGLLLPISASIPRSTASTQWRVLKNAEFYEKKLPSMVTEIQWHLFYKVLVVSALEYTEKSLGSCCAP